MATKKKRPTSHAEAKRKGVFDLQGQWLPFADGIEPGMYIDEPSDTRPDVVHHIYTGDRVNGLHCTCERVRHGMRERDVLFTCTHIRKRVFGLEE